MRASFLFLVLTLPLSAAVTGTVINRTTGQPQPGATVGLNRLGQNGIELIDQAKSDAQGHFTINQDLQGPQLLRTVYDGVSYNHMLPPGTPTTDVTVDVYNSSKLPGQSQVTRHMIVFAPTAAGEMGVHETLIYVNSGKTAWNDSDSGTLKLFLPTSSGGKAQVQATAPGGMPIGVAFVPSAKGEIRGIDFPIKPGETRFDVDYVVPYTPGSPYSGKIATKDENTYLVVPPGVTLDSKGVSDLGTEPKTQDHIYGLSAASYNITLQGAAAPPPDATDNASAADNSAPAGQTDQPQIEAILPRIYGNVYTILGLSLAILAVGFILLYRKSSAISPAAKEANERGRH